MAVFELMDVALVSDEYGRVTVPLNTNGREAVELPEGTVIGVALTFRTGEEVDGLTFLEERSHEGRVIAENRTVLGGFRAGGPYEIQLPAERLPIGRGCGTYEVTGRIVDPDGRELARERHRFHIVHRGEAALGTRRRHGRSPAATTPVHPGAARPA
ncbi:hypothetical protein Q5762_01230 [Streptomyces sp. P9(2023)]|uniref:hypothetical protein n=1 Tax=Streptomyces sp. P9(2023) TaxID=3064394 RepID=UPI0028F40D6E|nr:hypothetical protein [Streptomyces sp. P9(2023)]MDT9686992.1 hypothetical protein [Streptomyces sp. P9(2023)]